MQLPSNPLNSKSNRQTRDVHVHYPIVSAPNFKTFDEKLHELLTWKRALSRDMLNGTSELRVEDFGDMMNEAIHSSSSERPE